MDLRLALDVLSRLLSVAGQPTRKATFATDCNWPCAVDGHLAVIGWKMHWRPPILVMHPQAAFTNEVCVELFDLYVVHDVATIRRTHGAHYDGGTI
jgi:hypothetical protein